VAQDLLNTQVTTALTYHSETITSGEYSVQVG